MVSLKEIQALKSEYSKPKITKQQIRLEKIKQLLDLGVDVKKNVANEDLEALCKEYKVVVNETTILNNNTQKND